MTFLINFEESVKLDSIMSYILMSINPKTNPISTRFSAFLSVVIGYTLSRQYRDIRKIAFLAEANL